MNNPTTSIRSPVLSSVSKSLCADRRFDYKPFDYKCGERFAYYACGVMSMNAALQTTPTGPFLKGQFAVQPRRCVVCFDDTVPLCRGAGCRTYAVLATEDWQKKVSTALDCEKASMLHIEGREYRGCAAWLYGSKEAANLPDEFFWLLMYKIQNPASASLASMGSIVDICKTQLANNSSSWVFSYHPSYDTRWKKPWKCHLIQRQDRAECS
jgi:hypothetical protein